MRQRAILLLTALALLVTCALSSCSASAKAEDGRLLSIVTTSFPPYDFARAAAGDCADITMLLCPGAEAHSYEPTPLDIAKIQACDVFVYIGGEGEVWVDRILEAIDTSDKTVIRLFDFVSPLEEEKVGGEHHHDHGHSDSGHDDDDEEEAEYDEHIWTSPKNARLCVEGVCEGICRAIPEETDFDWESYIRANTAAYAERLSELDRQFTEMTQNAPSHLIVVGDRFPFRYLASDYGLEYLAAFSGCSSETEPGVYTMALLIDEILEHGVDTVFCLEFSTKKLAEKLCSATGAQMLTLHSMHNVSAEDFRSGITCADLLEKDLYALKEALY
ncbi:MAG: zinc ABC transporter substrate-binding protein [Ruminococcus sp.]|nr:zinc ABC transporter substrate-binding protein [Ruminococcus sp.]